MQEKIRLSTRGRITIPKPIRDEHGWRAGDRFVFEDCPDGLLMRPMTDEERREYAERRRKDAGTK